MTLESGRRLASYEIVGPIGAGGMGEVYRATDTRLGRDVAIKVLPSEVAQDPERLARFKREAQLLAALNHTNIAAIHGLEEADGTLFLALELVEGEDLAERLKRGKIPVQEALEIATQIADALEAAHDKGIVHRDLKPANVKITPEGQVKVLDFGLAKAWTGEAGSGTSSADLSQSPTLANTGTAAGLILGTAAYMSPEQASGKAVDKRTDIWAFGVVLFEMLIGDRVFSGDNVSEILASVIKDEPRWEQLPEATPRSVTRLLRRCLRRKPRERLHDIGDARLEIEEADSDPGEPEGSKRGTSTPARERVAWGLAAVLALATAGLGVRSLVPAGPARGPLHLSVPLTPAHLTGGFAVSPDGSQIVFEGRVGDETRRLYTRTLGEASARALPDTERALNPFFSPDGQWVAFFAGQPSLVLKKVPVSGGPAVVLAEGNFRYASGTWTNEGWIILGEAADDRRGALYRVPDDGGLVEPLAVNEEASGTFVTTVSAVPGGGVLLTLRAPGSAVGEDLAVAFQSLDTADRRTLAPGGANPRLLSSGHVVYEHSNQLVASRLDAEGMQLVGTPVPLRSVTGEDEIAAFDVSPNGVLAFLAKNDVGQPSRVVWTDRDGDVTPLPVDLEGGDMRLSPDNTRVVLGQREDVWVLDLDRGTRTRISAAAGEDETGAWSPDGQWIAWSGSRPGQERALFRRRSDGSGPEEHLWSDPRHFHVASWTSSGIVLTVDNPATGWDVLLLDPDDPAGVRTLLGESFNEFDARVSSDGRLLAFVSDETGQLEVYVQGFPEPRGKVQVSVDGGVQPVWRPGTREILYRGSGQLMGTVLGPGDRPSVDVPRGRWDDRLAWLDQADHTHFDVHRDGRLLAVEEPDQPPVRSIRVVLDWMEAVGLRP